MDQMVDMVWNMMGMGFGIQIWDDFGLTWAGLALGSDFAKPYGVRTDWRVLLRV